MSDYIDKVVGEFEEDFPCIEQIGEGIKCKMENVTENIKSFLLTKLEEQEKKIDEVRIYYAKMMQEQSEKFEGELHHYLDRAEKAIINLDKKQKQAITEARIEELELSLKAHERHSGTVGVSRIINERITQLKKAK